ncbi:MAG: OmpA family protein [Rhodospirillales bacterium]|nr:OmpA family protein [Rhodospirillales bacterium]
MTKDNSKGGLRKRVAMPSFAGAMVLGLTALGGCSSVPDAINPIEWYKGTADFLSGDKQAEPAQALPQPQSGLVASRGAPAPGADQPFPKLSSVPERPRSSGAQVAQGLSGDTQQRQYASGPIQRQGLDSAPPPPPAPSATAPQIKWNDAAGAAAPPPPATPVVPVTSAQASQPSTPMTSEDMEATQKAYERKLAEIRAKAMESPNLPAEQSQLSIGTDSFETVVVNSGGTVSGEPAMTAPVGGGSFATTNGLAVGSVKVATILFANGSAQLDVRDRAILKEVTLLQKKSGGNIRISGHASSRTENMDPVKHKMVNYRISADRAQKIATELARLGVDRKNILISARSDTEPLFYEVMPAGEAGNRRTDIYIDY